MVGNTGRKCSSQGINVIWGGSQCMGNPYKPLLSPKSIKIDRRIQLIVSKSTHEPNIWGLVVARASPENALFPRRHTLQDKAFQKFRKENCFWEHYYDFESKNR